MKLDILKALEKRRRKKVEINKSMVSNIQYHADVRRQIDREQMRAEHTRIKAQLAKTGVWIPSVMRDRYDLLQKEFQ
jgi:hypothetical protein